MSLPRKAQFAIGSILTALSVFWLYEAYTCGFCWFSRYVAPVVIVGNLVMAVNAMTTAAKALDAKRRT